MIQAMHFTYLGGRVAHVLPREIHVKDPFRDTHFLRIRTPWEVSGTIEVRRVPRECRRTLPDGMVKQRIATLVLITV